LFKGDPDANYQADKYKIECADSFVADVNEITYYNKDGSEKVEYDGIKYSAGLNYDKEKYMSEFVLKNEEGKKLLELSVFGSQPGWIRGYSVFGNGRHNEQYLCVICMG